jgi:hypothetical protein
VTPRPCVRWVSAAREKVVELFGGDRGGTRPAERVEDRVPFPVEASSRAQRTRRRRFWVVAVEPLSPGHGRYAPEVGDLRAGVGAVYEVVVEGVAHPFALARPQGRLVSVGPRKLGQRVCA